MDVRYKNAIKYFDKMILSEIHDANIACWVAGGAVRNYFAGKSLDSDIDLFFPGESNFMRAKIFFSDVEKYEMLHDSDNATKYKRLSDKRTFDIIKKFFDNPFLCIDAFDFTVCQFAIDNTGHITIGEHSLLDLAKRQLMMHKINYPYSTLHRTVRYLKKGYSICMEELDKIHDAIQATTTPVVETTEGEESPMSSSSRSNRFHFD